MNRVFVIGCGGIGSNLASPLIKFLAYEKANKKAVPRVTFVDGDHVEKKNLIRQSFIITDVGKSKAQIMADSLAAMYPDLQIDFIPKYVKPENIEEIICDNSVLLVGVDNYITRRIIEERMDKCNNIVAIIGANEYHDGDVNVMIRKDGKWTTPKLTEKHPAILVKDRFPDEIGCEEAAKAAPQIITTNLMAATIMLGAYYSLYTKGTIVGHETFFDLSTFKIRIQE